MFVSIALLLAAAAPTTEPARLPPEVACVMGQITQTDRSGILAEASSGVGSTIRDRFRQAAATCARQEGWSPDLAQRIERIAGGVIVGQEAAVRLEAADISPELIDRWFDAQPPAVRSAQLTPAHAEQLIQHLAGQGIPMERLLANARYIGLYSGALNLIAATAAAGTGN